MYCHIIACTHHTWRQVDEEWDVPRLIAWNRYSIQIPPLHALVAKYLKYEPPPREEKPLTQAEHAARLMGQLGFNV